MEISEDDIEERALEIFNRERPDDIWSIQTKPRGVGQDVGANVGHEVRKKYRVSARIELEYERGS